MEIYALRHLRHRAAQTRRRDAILRNRESRPSGNAVPDEPAASSAGWTSSRSALALLTRIRHAAEAGTSPRAIFLKSLEDRILAALLLLFCGPLIIFLAAAVKIESPGPAFVRECRLGFGSLPAIRFKFRCESDDACRATGASRLTCVGSFLRASGLEELPQLISVLIGHRSIVGVHLPVHLPRCAGTPLVDAVMSCASRHGFKPGLTGLSKINDRHDSEVLSTRIEQWANDEIDYMQNWSVRLDAVIMLETVRLIFSGKRRQL